MGFELSMAARNIAYGIGNVLLNGFDFEIKEADRHLKIPITIYDFIPINEWEEKSDQLIDLSTNNGYDDESISNLRAKCAAIFAGTFILQAIGLVLNAVNRIIKLALFAH